MPYITGYADPLSVKPGETIRFMLSAEGANTAEAAIVRLVHGDEHPEGPGFVEQEVATDIVREVALEHQPTQVGSFLEIEDPQARLALAGDFTLHAWIWPGPRPCCRVTMRPRGRATP
jgi:N,N-dimethylformamidase